MKLLGFYITAIGIAGLLVVLSMSPKLNNKKYLVLLRYSAAVLTIVLTIMFALAIISSDTTIKLF